MYFSLDNSIDNILKRERETGIIVEPAIEKPKKKKKKNPLLCQEWKDLRKVIINRDGNKCKYCGKIAEGSDLNIDHIKPKSLFPELIFDPDNLQVLCRKCNFKKNTNYE